MIKIYDTLTAKKVDFVPLDEGKVGIYVCGPTVYDSAHLGHGRSAVSFDVIRRYFIYRGYEVKYVSNYTDIDDKMINRANQEGISVKELSDKVIPIYAKDYGALGVMVPDVQPLATDHVPEMIELIQGLEKQGFTYVLDDGVYYEVAKFTEYGKLSKQKLEDLRVGSRVEVKDGKKSPYDFVLWKFKKEGEPSWSSPWGEGRPGWHIECSAMTWKHLGEKFDIHGGGLDLTFPHHECEIAQSEPVFGKGSFSKYWMHNGFINVDNEKMSKSLGNFFTLKEIFEKYDPKVVRFMFLQTHYRNPVNFSNVLLDQAKAGLSRLHDFVRNLNALLDAADDGVVS
ncbi:cysteine--tRNA ligase, partial [Candidatus Gracilibacteria bacterium]|nr:cysteine--tRNA ligase [Candidatus Gracilibacteria bacterium]